MTTEQKEVRARLQEIARAIEGRLPKGYGFFLLCFPFDAPAGTRGEYVSNANRADVSREMARFIARNPMPDFRNVISLQRGSHCGICYWALYDGDWCQNKDCVMSGESVGENRIYLTNIEAQILIGAKSKANE